MNGPELDAIALRLEHALRAAGLEVVKGRTEGGNLAAWDPVPAGALLGAWLQRRYVVRDQLAPSGRADIHEATRIVAPERFGKVLEFRDRCHGVPVGPGGQSAHGSEDDGSDHQTSTEESP